MSRYKPNPKPATHEVNELMRKGFRFDGDRARLLHDEFGLDYAIKGASHNPANMEVYHQAYRDYNRYCSEPSPNQIAHLDALVPDWKLYKIESRGTQRERVFTAYLQVHGK